ERGRQDRDHDGASPAREDEGADGPVALPRRRTPKLVSSHGRPVPERTARDDADETPVEDSGRRAARTPTREGRATTQGRPGEPPALPARRRREDRTENRAGVRDGRDADRTDPEALPSLPARRRGASPERAGSSTDDGEHRNRGARHAPGLPGTSPDAEPGTGALPRRVRQASLAPQLRQSARTPADDRPDPTDRDAEEVRSRMASLQRGWQRGRRENATGDDVPGGTAPQAPRGTTKGDGR
ncbi:histidine kinase, partial [Streptomyces mutabilis]